MKLPDSCWKNGLVIGSWKLSTLTVFIYELLVLDDLFCFCASAGKMRKFIVCGLYSFILGLQPYRTSYTWDSLIYFIIFVLIYNKNATAIGTVIIFIELCQVRGTEWRARRIVIYNEEASTDRLFKWSCYKARCNFASTVRWRLNRARFSFSASSRVGWALRVLRKTHAKLRSRRYWRALLENLCFRVSV